MTDPSPVVGVLAASPSELPIMRQTGLILEKFDVPHEVRIMSSSRNSRSTAHTSTVSTSSLSMRSVSDCRCSR